MGGIRRLILRAPTAVVLSVFALATPPGPGTSSLAAGSLAAGSLAAGPPAGTALDFRLPALDGGLAQSYAGAGFTAPSDLAPTAPEAQNKLWFNDGAWWALMLTPSGALTIHELAPDHTWRQASEPLTTAPTALGDVVPGAADVSVIFSREQGLAFARLDYDPARRAYVLDDGGIVAVTDESGRNASIDVDITGRLWIAFVTRSQVLVTSSTDGGASWRAAVPPSVDGTDIGTGEIAAVVAFDNSVGVMWSDQQRSRFSFAVHDVDAPENEGWMLETALAGDGMADDHINLKVADGQEGDTVLAAVKTSQDSLEAAADAPLMMMLARSPGGQWVSHVAGTIADNQNRPSLVVDESTNAVHFVSQAPATGGAIYIKSAPLDDLAFPPGRGDSLMEAEGRLADVTTPAQPVTSATGMVLLTSNTDAMTYHHVEVALPSPAGEPLLTTDDGTAPAAPEDLAVAPREEDSVWLHWSPSVNPLKWAPALDGVPAASYVIVRDGTPVQTTKGTSFLDHPPVAGRLSYSVIAVDQSGNMSPPSAVASVDLTEAPAQSLWSWWYLAVTAAGALGIAAATVAMRRRRANPPASDWYAPSTKVQADAGVGWRHENLSGSG